MKMQLTRGAALILALGIILGGGTAHAAKGGEPGPGGKANGRQPGPRCISPSGRDVNELWGVDHRIVAHFCPEALTGERIGTTNLWIAAETFEAVPDGFVPAGDTPLEDFLAKFAGVRYVIDPGTAHERVYVFDDVDRVGVLHDDGAVLLNIVTMGSLHPLPAGEHVIETYWIFDEEHCDGIDPDRFANCFPAGETMYDHFSFDVKPRSTNS